METILRFLIVGGLPIFAVGLEQVISRHFKAEVRWIEEPRDGVDVCASAPFDLVLIGVTQPEQSGLDLLPDFQKRCPSCRILLVSLLAEEDFTARALRAGADGYILKSSSEAELVCAISSILNGGKYVSQEFASRVAESFESKTAKLHDLLSPREFEVFLRIARGSTAKEIAVQLSLSVKTISTYHTHTLHKLNLRNDAELGEYALRHGLVA